MILSTLLHHSEYTESCSVWCNLNRFFYSCSKWMLLIHSGQRDRYSEGVTSVLQSLQFYVLLFLIFDFVLLRQIVYFEIQRKFPSVLWTRYSGLNTIFSVDTKRHGQTSPNVVLQYVYTLCISVWQALPPVWGGRPQVRLSYCCQAWKHSVLSRLHTSKLTNFRGNTGLSYWNSTSDYSDIWVKHILSRLLEHCFVPLHCVFRDIITRDRISRTQVNDDSSCLYLTTLKMKMMDHT